MKTEEKYIDDALFLFKEFGNEDVTFYDGDSLVHTMKNGVIDVSTMESDNTTYHVTLRDGLACVTKSYCERERELSSPMTEEDFVELANQLAYFSASIRSEKALQDVDMNAMGRRLLDVLFDDPALGARPNRAPTLKKNSFQIAQTIGGVLKKAKRQAQFEWKEWADDGLRAVNKMGALKGLGIVLAPPGAQEITDTAAAADHGDGVLNWFHGRLSVHGLTLVALTPLDELQSFSLVSISQFDELQTLLKQLNVRVAVSSGLS